ncbi:hypothetical protein C7293_15385 [filamentous cyanobacterium CCT1]|nr:hypothetical protein C7293_15385 [filamentous cyanobacterium CCT1]PSN76184.1 hypothetical protein C8B47_28630 [filamentous cyanobacterium CCP4]
MGDRRPPLPPISSQAYPLKQRYHGNNRPLARDPIPELRLMTTQSPQLSHHFYNLFQALPDDAKQGFLTTLITQNRQEIEDLLFHQDCKAAKEEGFLSDQEAQDFVANLSH